MRILRKINFKIVLAIMWSLFTSSLIIWWWIWALKLSVADSKSHKMITYEGLTLISIVLIGSVFLIGYVWQDHKRNQKLKLFFSIFTHDIKTSISRLRLQAEVLDEDFKSSHNNPTLSRLVQDVMKLDLQLENALLFANIENNHVFFQKILLSQLIAAVRPEFPDLNIHLQSDAQIDVDKKSFTSILRNTFRNAELHGKASRIDITIEPSGTNEIKLSISDNGVGFKGDIAQLGLAFQPSQNQLSNGLGLFLSRSMIQKQRGRISFGSTADGFCTTIYLPGKAS